MITHEVDDLHYCHLCVGISTLNLVHEHIPHVQVIIDDRIWKAFDTERGLELHERASLGEGHAKQTSHYLTKRMALSGHLRYLSDVIAELHPAGGE